MLLFSILRETVAFIIHKISTNNLNIFAAMDEFRIVYGIDNSILLLQQFLQYTI